MFFAINKKTGEKIHALEIEENSSYQFPHEEEWYADPDEISFCPNEIDIDKILVRFREGSTDRISTLGKKFGVAPHFFIPNKSKLAINTIPESKEHKLAKNWIYGKIKEKSLLLNYSSVSKPFKYNNEINLFNLPIDFKLVGIETTSSTFGKRIYRRADVICPFIVKHPLLGNGIVFEIQFSKQKDKTRHNRELDWAIRGYSVCWLFPEDFEEINSTSILLKKESVNVSSFSSLIKLNNKEHIRDLKFSVQEEVRKLECKKLEIRTEINDMIESKLKFEVPQIEDTILDMVRCKFSKIQPTCPNCKIPMLLKKGKFGQFWGCVNYPLCKSISKFIGE